MIVNDGGKGNLDIIYPEKLGIWNTLLSGEAHATWIFDNWEGIEASGKNIELDKFALNDFNIPYGYSPIVLTKKKNLTQNKTLYSKFIKATQKGFLYTKNNQAESAALLKRHVTPYDLMNIDIEKSVAFSTPHFGDESNCGMLNPTRVTRFLKWIVDHGLEDEVILKQRLFTNELF